MPDAQIPADDPSRKLVHTNADTDTTLPHISLVGDTYTTLLKGADTANRYCLIDMHIPPNGGPGPHRHDFEETFILLDGTLDFTFRGQHQTASAGDTVHIPANAPHQFHNSSNAPARLLCLCSPAGQEEFFAEIGTPVPTRTTAPPKPTPDQQKAFLEKAKALAPKFKTELLEKA